MEYAPGERMRFGFTVVGRAADYMRVVLSTRGLSRSSCRYCAWGSSLMSASGLYLG
jgi:hypothetical protein